MNYKVETSEIDSKLAMDAMDAVLEAARAVAARVCESTGIPESGDSVALNFIYGALVEHDLGQLLLSYKLAEHGLKVVPADAVVLDADTFVAPAVKDIQ